LSFLETGNVLAFANTAANQMAKSENSPTRFRRFRRHFRSNSRAEIEKYVVSPPPHTALAVEICGELECVPFVPNVPYHGETCPKWFHLSHMEGKLVVVVS
jgi:hypothetical protein